MYVQFSAFVSKRFKSSFLEFFLWIKISSRVISCYKHRFTLHILKHQYVQSLDYCINISCNANKEDLFDNQELLLYMLLIISLFSCPQGLIKDDVVRRN